MHWFLIDFCLRSRTRAVLVVRLLIIHFNERVTSSNLSIHLHVILHAGLARSCRIHCLMNARETFSPSKVCSPLGMRGDEKSSSSVLTHRLRHTLPSPGELSFMMIVSSTSTYHGSLCQDSFLKNQIKKPVVDI